MKRKNKPIRRPDAVQPLPLPADADEIAFAHGVSQQARDAVGHVPAAPAPRPRQKSYTGLLIWLCSVAGVLAAGIGYCLYCVW